LAAQPPIARIGPVLEATMLKPVALALLTIIGLVAEDAPAPAPAVTDAQAADAASDELPTGPFDKAGKVVRAAYLRLALDDSIAAVDKRLGPDAEQLAKAAGVKKTTAKKAAGKNEEPPIYLRPVQQSPKIGRNGAGMPYSLGTPVTDPGDYSSTDAQVMYIPDKTGDPGVDRIEILGMGHMTFCFLPAPTWWGGSHPEPMVKTGSWLQATGGSLGAPVAVARGYGRWCNSALMVFRSGLIGTAGTATSQSNAAFTLLPRTKVPTAISLTSQNEFALVTVWDTEKLKGQVAVIALGSFHKEGLMALYDWQAPHPGLMNVGGFTTLKIIGYLDLPIATPTAVSAASNRMGDWAHLDGKNAELCKFDLAQQGMRDRFATGENAKVPSTCGYAVVTSRYENKAVFIDLQPLFQYMGAMYFTSEENYRKTLDQGPEPKQWPFTFETEPRQKPVPIAVVPVKSPTAVAVSVSGGSGAWAGIATLDGKVFFYRLGGLADDTPAAPGDIKPLAMASVGRNPTCIAYSKNVGWGTPATLNTTVIVVCRGDRELCWVNVADGTVTRRLRDSRLTDPVWAEVADTHGTESHIVSICDFKGRKVWNYRFGPVIFHTNGGKRFDVGEDGKADFECGGSMDFPGFPFALCGTNVN
jgi:hypothetical protein